MKFKVLIVFFVVVTNLIAQQQALFTHYMNNTLAVNPAYAGSRDALSITALSRFQWLGFNGAPNTQTLTLHTPLKNPNIGLGFSFLNEKIGPVTNNAIYVDLAYRIKLNLNWKLSFGIKGGIDNFNIGLNKLIIHDPNDVSFQTGIRNRVLPNIGSGLYLNHKNFYFGISAPRFLESSFYKSSNANSTNVAQQKRHFYLITGGLVSLTPRIKWKPVAQFKAVFNAPFQIDITNSLIINDIVSFGLMYRTGDAVGALIDVNLNEQFTVGYSLDYSFVNRTSTYNSGSHELMLRYDFIFEKDRRIKSPRYF